MNKIVKIFTLSCLLATSAVSCIQDEAPNAECDIITCTISPDSILLAVPVVENEKVTIRIKPGEDISNLAPVFTITEGATITPDNGSAHDFLNAPNHTVNYTVTSEDGEWSKVYPVRISQKEIPSTFSFNTPKLDSQLKYYEINETDEYDEIVMTWAAGNPGYVISGVAEKEAQLKYGPNDYKEHVWEYFPTTPVWNENNEVEYVRLETKSTGTFGKMVGMPIAAGNIFQGYFDLSMAISNPRGATKFGEPYRYDPKFFSGKYRYKAGEVMTDSKGNVLSGEKDTFSIYALFFDTELDKNNDGTIQEDERIDYITGHIHQQNFKDPYLVSVAMVEDTDETSEWKEFRVPFKSEGLQVDPDRLAKGKYKVGIVISSSIDGDVFRGAVGSCLDVKDLKLEH